MIKPTYKLMQKISFILLTVIFFFSFPFFLSAQSFGRQKINLDSDWKFAFGHAANPEIHF